MQDNTQQKEKGKINSKQDSENDDEDIENHEQKPVVSSYSISQKNHSLNTLDTTLISNQSLTSHNNISTMNTVHQQQTNEKEQFESISEEDLEKKQFQQQEIEQRMKKSSLQKQLNKSSDPKSPEKSENQSVNCQKSTENSVSINIIKNEQQQQQQQQSENMISKSMDTSVKLQKQQSQQKQAKSVQNLQINENQFSSCNGDLNSSNSLLGSTHSTNRGNSNLYNYSVYSSVNSSKSPLQNNNNMSINSSKRGSNMSQSSLLASNNGNNSSSNKSSYNYKNNDWMPSGVCPRLDVLCQRFIEIKKWENKRSKEFSIYRTIFVRLLENLNKIMAYSDENIQYLIKYIQQHVYRNSEIVYQLNSHAFSKRHKVKGTIVGNAYQMLEGLNCKKGILFERQNRVLNKLLDQLNKNLELNKSKINLDKFIITQQAKIQNFDKQERGINSHYQNYQEMIGKNGKATAKKKEVLDIDFFEQELIYFNSVQNHHNFLQNFGKEVIDFYYLTVGLETSRIQLMKDVMHQYVDQQQNLYNNLNTSQLLDQLDKIDIELNSKTNLSLEQLLLPEWITYIKKSLNIEFSSELDIKHLETFSENFVVEEIESKPYVQESFQAKFLQKNSKLKQDFVDINIVKSIDGNMIFQKGKEVSMFQLPFLVIPSKQICAELNEKNGKDCLHDFVVTKMKNILCFCFRKSFYLQFSEQLSLKCKQEIINKFNVDSEQNV